MDLFVGKTLSNKSQATISGEDALRNKVVGLYFSASWCPPCKMFTPILADVYSELKEKNAPFEIVFISSDRSPQDMKQYMVEEHGDWLCVPFGDALVGWAVSRPLFCNDESEQNNSCELIDPNLLSGYSYSPADTSAYFQNGDVITDQGRSEVQTRGPLAFKNWLQASNIVQNFSAE
ncbi:nucleoredoxin-like protein 2 [Saccoglossus kowalevskii]|uniref:Nucleoredoxin-like protein 2-like n=1 Tax=Saccoglossus kowalevskii TaxID=10224 RepID=A0ABM0GVE2_SACKO|nr:PREDICTED: nucleoredoxin-like protein 2-like [Saccoglossus kowalevskii]